MSVWLLINKKVRFEYIARYSFPMRAAGACSLKGVRYVSDVSALRLWRGRTQTRTSKMSQKLFHACARSLRSRDQQEGKPRGLELPPNELDRSRPTVSFIPWKRSQPDWRTSRRRRRFYHHPLESAWTPFIWCASVFLRVRWGSLRVCGDRRLEGSVWAAEASAESPASLVERVRGASGGGSCATPHDHHHHQDSHILSNERQKSATGGSK